MAARTCSKKGESLCAVSIPCLVPGPIYSPTTRPYGQTWNRRTLSAFLRWWTAQQYPVTYVT